MRFKLYATPKNSGEYLAVGIFDTAEEAVSADTAMGGHYHPLIQGVSDTGEKLLSPTNGAEYLAAMKAAGVPANYICWG